MFIQNNLFIILNPIFTALMPLSAINNP